MIQQQLQLRNKVINIQEPTKLNNNNNDNMIISTPFNELLHILATNDVHTERPTFYLLDINSMAMSDKTLAKLQQQVVTGNKSIVDTPKTQGRTKRRVMQYTHKTLGNTYPLLKHLVESIAKWTELTHEANIATIIHSLIGKAIVKYIFT